MALALQSGPTCCPCCCCFSGLGRPACAPVGVSTPIMQHCADLQTWLSAPCLCLQVRLVLDSACVLCALPCDPLHALALLTTLSSAPPPAVLLALGVLARVLLKNAPALKQDAQYTVPSLVQPASGSVGGTWIPVQNTFSNLLCRAVCVPCRLVWPRGWKQPGGGSPGGHRCCRRELQRGRAGAGCAGRRGGSGAACALLEHFAGHFGAPRRPLAPLADQRCCRVPGVAAAGFQARRSVW